MNPFAVYVSVFTCFLFTNRHTIEIKTLHFNLYKIITDGVKRLNNRTLCANNNNSRVSYLLFSCTQFHMTKCTIIKAREIRNATVIVHLVTVYIHIHKYTIYTFILITIIHIPTTAVNENNNCAGIIKTYCYVYYQQPATVSSTI